MKRLFAALLAVSTVTERQSAGQFDPARLTPAIDSFALVMPVTGKRIGVVVQTLARDGKDIRLAVTSDVAGTQQRVEMLMDGRSLAPRAHWESLKYRGREGRGEVHFVGGRAKGAFIRATHIIDVPVDSGVVDDEASTALLAALRIERGDTVTFRTFASPGQVEMTRVISRSTDTVKVPAGRFVANRLTVMARDTSDVFVSATAPHRVVLVRLQHGGPEMQLINRPR